MAFSELSQHINDNIDKLYSSVICDVMDRMGYWDQTMEAAICPLDPKSTVFGRARTVQAVRVFEVPEEPYELEMEAVDALQSGDVLVVTQTDCYTASFWGELLSNAAKGHDARGIIIDGYTRDSIGIMNLGFPCFVKGTTPADSCGRLDVIAVDTSITCGGVRVTKGDYVFGDLDGVVVIPQDIANEVLEKALEKVSGENDVRRELLAGVSVKDVFKKYGIL